MWPMMSNEFDTPDLEHFDINKYVLIYFLMLYFLSWSHVTYKNRYQKHKKQAPALSEIR